jgi:hypothetical protein
MALVDTSRNSTYFDSIPDLVLKLRDTLIEELAAINTYDQLIASIRRMGLSGIDQQGNLRSIPDNQLSTEAAGKLADFFVKIRDEELEHSGAITQLMCDLDSNVKERMAAGV